jgi:hypothetical protein
VKNSFKAILCLGLLSFWCIPPGRAQVPEGTPAPQTPPAQPAAQPSAAQPPDETPAPQQRTGTILAPPPLPKYPDVQMPGETGYYAELIGWLPFGTPILDKGHAADWTGATYFHLPGTPTIAPGGSIGLALGLHNSLDLSYFSTKSRGNVIAPGAVVVFGESYNKGDLLATSDKVQDIKLSFEYLTWPYPVESRHFRLRTLWQVHYLEVNSNYDAPIRSSTPDSSGNLTSYATTGAKGMISPALGLGFTEYASRNFRLALNIAGFDVPHHFAIGDADASASYRLGRIEIRVGAKGMYLKTSPQADYYFRARLAGAFVGLRWCSD